MKHNKDSPYPTKEEAIKNVKQWLSKNIRKNPNISMNVYSLYPFCPTDCKVIVIIDNITHKTLKRVYFKERE